MKKYLLIKLLFILFIPFSLLSEESYWLPTGDLPNGVVEAMIYRHSTNSLFASIYNVGIFRSTDQGQSWLESSQGLPDKLVKSIALSKDGIIYAGLNSSGVYKSTDNGNNWIEVNDGLTNKNVLDLYCHDNGDIYAGTWFFGHVFKLVSGATSWVNVGVDADVHAVAVDKNNNIYAGTRYLGIYRTTNGGKDWLQSGLSTFDTKQIIVTKSNEVFAATNNGIYKFNGTNWINSSSGITIPSILSIIANDSDYLFAGLGYDGGVYKSIDAGTNWEEVITGLADSTVYSFAQDSTWALYAGTSNGVYRTRFSTSSVAEIINNKLQVYPNPARDRIDIIIQDESQSNVNIINSLGSIVMSCKKTSTEAGSVFSINVSHLEQGQYYLVLSQGIKTYISSFIILR